MFLKDRENDSADQELIRDGTRGFPLPLPKRAAKGFEFRFGSTVPQNTL